MISRRQFLYLGGAALLASRHAALAEPGPALRGREFLAGLFDPELGLLPEYRGAKTYWLSHDNYLAAKVLAQSHPKISTTIMETIQREGLGQSDGKTEMLFGEPKDVLPFRRYDLTVVRTVGDKVIRTEVATANLMKGWERYADLLFLAAIAQGKEPSAQQNWDAAMRLWDGKGFDDAATRSQKTYSTYKLALAAISAARLSRTVELPPALRERLHALQAESGGWVTNYDASGKPHGFANVETSCLAILGVEALVEKPKQETR